MNKILSSSYIQSLIKKSNGTVSMAKELKYAKWNHSVQIKHEFYHACSLSL